MFIAVINENFNVAEESKKGQQATDYWAKTHEPFRGHVSWIRRLNPYRWVKAAPVSVRVEHLPSNLVLPMQKALVQDYNMPGRDGRPAPVRPFHRITYRLVFIPTSSQMSVPSAAHVTIPQNLSRCYNNSFLESQGPTMYPLPQYAQAVVFLRVPKTPVRMKPNDICEYAWIMCWLHMWLPF